MHIDEEVHERTRQTIGALTFSEDSPPAFAQFAAAAGVAKRRRRPVVIALVLLAVGGIAVIWASARTTTTGSRVVDCAETITIDGRTYQVDDFNDGLIATNQLGDRLGVVATERICADMGGDEEPAPDQVDGVQALGVVIGSEVFSIPGESTDLTIAASTPTGVRIFRAQGSDPLDFAAEVTSIDISMSDGLTRLATIADPLEVASLVDEARSTPIVDGEDTWAGDRYFVTFVHADGLVTSLPYLVEERRLGQRSINEDWATAITVAVDAGSGVS